MSRGKLIIAVSPVTGSTLTTMSVSVRAVFRRSDESMPVRRTLIRDSRVGGVACGVAWNPSLGAGAGADEPGTPASGGPKIRSDAA
jgi:hypothetical protein